MSLVIPAVMHAVLCLQVFYIFLSVTYQHLTRETLKWWEPQSVPSTSDGELWEQSSNCSLHPYHSCCAGVTLALVPIMEQIQYKLCLLVVPHVGGFGIHREPIDADLDIRSLMIYLAEMIRPVSTSVSRRHLPFHNTWWSGSTQAVNHRKNLCAWMFKWVPYSQRYLVLGLVGLVGLGLPLL